MNDKVTAALAQLNQTLPLVERQSHLTPEAIRVHHEILGTYARTGSSPRIDKLATGGNNIKDTLLQLQQLDLIVLDADANIIGAYPFTSEARIHRVDIGDHSVHCMCALDALAISPMFECNTVVHSQCALSSSPIKIQQSGRTVLNPDQYNELFLAIDWAAVSSTTCCANSLCKQMNFILGSERAHDWLQQSNQYELFTLDEAIEFAARFFVPLISREQAA